MPGSVPASPVVIDLLTQSPHLHPRGDDRFRLVRPGQSANRPTPFDPGTHGNPCRTFAVQDYLALADHPGLRAATTAALSQHRLCPAGTATCLGLTVPVLALEDRTARFLHLSAAVVFPSGAEAIRATLRAILSPGDAVIVDAGAHPAMFETVLTAGARPHRSPPGSVEGVERRLLRLSRTRRAGRLWVAVPAISAHASVMADLADLAALCNRHGAGLIVDVAHDLGAMGQSGGGVMEIQGCLGRPSVVIGSFAKCFGAPGGFAAVQDPNLKARLRDQQGTTAALSPVLAATILAAFDIIDSPEGVRRRRRLHANSLRLRNHLMADGVRVMGQPSPLVPVRLPPGTALARTALLQSAGLAVTLLGPPTVALHAPRWRLQLSADHGPADIDGLADMVRDVVRW
ncbi:aminotransferase class I/II-fold pyridoxal phosphate-dependent enzyme [Tabrizicola piscis]|uniref:Aminotransferase class I/II-fold pyridoxal phosphate-dependent enzyme n=1 Tax=Tabrizicola piscis TaxID=2494374 RepID=A0A3S8U6K1_9RHOB|nr:aminotransferase class I/II-fold pyridoxal phosphate-dependent enzyme [Tabrizicola piscis]AZL59185.1 aminotransferase class I/II-fold pyridoxal phosphate-dependent enzyme [Tabrizicola piscis]